MSKPEFQQMGGIIGDIKQAFADVREDLTDGFTKPVSAKSEQALASLETFIAVALRVMRDTNPSKLRNAARAEEIRAYMTKRAMRNG